MDGSRRYQTSDVAVKQQRFQRRPREQNDGEKKRGNLGRNGKAEEMKGVAEEMEERAPGLKELVPQISISIRD